MELKIYGRKMFSGTGPGLSSFSLKFSASIILHFYKSNSWLDDGIKTVRLLSFYLRAFI